MEIIRTAIRTGRIMGISDITLYKLKDKNLILLADEPFDDKRLKTISLEDFQKKKNFFLTLIMMK
jgi:hypothetical protein